MSNIDYPYKYKYGKFAIELTDFRGHAWSVTGKDTNPIASVKIVSDSRAVLYLNLTMPYEGLLEHEQFYIHALAAYIGAELEKNDCGIDLRKLAASLDNTPYRLGRCILPAESSAFGFHGDPTVFVNLRTLGDDNGEGS